MLRSNLILYFVLLVLRTSSGLAQQQQENHPLPSASKQGETSSQGTMPQEGQHTMPMQMQMPGMDMQMNEAGMFLMKQASGTSVNPDSSPEPMWMMKARSWNLMFHTSIFVNELQQTGPRGADKFFSTNWFMGMAEQRLGSGSFMVRAMVSLDPLTVTRRRYPELFQTGETALGKPLIDAQHPHDLLMEIGVQYARPLAEKTMLNLYFAPVGDPALGPVAFPHRISAAELPQAVLGHHVQDSTHIANEVITAGVTRGPVRFEASGFHGAEPNENRWNIDHGAIDSWSARLVFSPRRNWIGQASVGRLAKPEALEAGDIVRSTASATYNRPLAAGFWATSFVWGRNHKTETKQDVNSFLGESLLQFSGQNYLTGRLEVVDKEELFTEQDAFAGRVFRIAAYTLGYTRGITFFPRLQAGLGGNFTLYTIPGDLKPSYGEHPASFLLYFRLRPGRRT